MCPSKLQTEIVAHACSCIFIKFQNKIYHRPGLESSPDAAVQCCVGRPLLKNCSLTTLRALVSVSTTTTNLSRTLNSHLVSRENLDIAVFWAVKNGNRIATEGMNGIWSFQRRSTSHRAFLSVYTTSAMSWTVVRYIVYQIKHRTFAVTGRSGASASKSSRVNSICRRKERSSGRQSLVKEHFKDSTSSSLHLDVSRNLTNVTYRWVRTMQTFGTATLPLRRRSRGVVKDREFNSFN